MEAGGACRPAALNKVHVLPVIAREDYDNFRSDIGLGARMTYADWSGVLSRQVEIARDSGLAVVIAEIIDDHFREYCLANSRKPDQAMLLAYSRLKKGVIKTPGLVQRHRLPQQSPEIIPHHAPPPDISAPKKRPMHRTGLFHAIGTIFTCRS